MSVVNFNHTTLKVLFKNAIERNGDDEKQAIYNHSQKFLNEEFWKGSEDKQVDSKYINITCWCGDKVYISTYNDNLITIISTLRNPPQ